MPRLACAGCGAEFLCAASFRGKTPKCSGCRRRATQGRGRDATAEARSAPQNGAAGAPQPRHMTPCACHCAACRAAGHGNKCVEIRKALLRLFKADVVDFWILRHYYGACGWGTARLDAEIRCVQYGPAGDVIAAGDETGRIHFICAQTGEKILCPRGEKKIKFVAFSPDGSLIAAGDGGIGQAGTIRLYNTATGDPFGSPLRGHRDSVTCVAFKPDNPNIVVSSSYDETIKTWDITSGSCLSTLRGENAIFSLAFSPDGQLIATGEGNLYNPSEAAAGAVRIYCASTGQVKRALRVGGEAESVHWSPCGTKIAAACNDYDTDNYCVKILNSETGALLCALNVGGSVSSIDFAPCGNKLAAAFNIHQGIYFKEGGVKIFSNQGSAGFVCQSTLRGHTDRVWSVCFSSDGKQLTSGSQDKTVRNWDLATRASLS